MKRAILIVSALAACGKGTSEESRPPPTGAAEAGVAAAPADAQPAAPADARAVTDLTALSILRAAWAQVLPQLRAMGVTDPAASLARVEAANKSWLDDVNALPEDKRRCMATAEFPAGADKVCGLEWNPLFRVEDDFDLPEDPDWTAEEGAAMLAKLVGRWELRQPHFKRVTTWVIDAAGKVVETEANEGKPPETETMWLAFVGPRDTVRVKDAPDDYGSGYPFLLAGDRFYYTASGQYHHAIPSEQDFKIASEGYNVARIAGKCQVLHDTTLIGYPARCQFEDRDGKRVFVIDVRHYWGMQSVSENVFTKVGDRLLNHWLIDDVYVKVP